MKFYIKKILKKNLLQKLFLKQIFYSFIFVFFWSHASKLHDIQSKYNNLGV